jgi:nitric oxide reductase subunit C
MWLVACAGAPASTATPAVAGDAARGRALFERKVILSAGAPGCVTCHSLAPDVILVGPSLAGVATRAEAVARQPGYAGLAADAAGYLRESIVAPDAFVVEGFAAGSMYPNFAADLTPQEVADLTEYLLTLK